MEHNTQKELAIGIDLGTTYSTVGVWKQVHDRAEIIVNRQGGRVTPSCVAFANNKDSHLIGEAAINQSHMNPSNTISGVKRLIGRKFSDEPVQSFLKHCSFKVVPDTRDRPQIVVSHKGAEKYLAPEEISAMILSYMRDIAQEYLMTEIKNVVVAVPAYFNDSQRRATQDACTIAGLKVMRIINEPTAAAIAYSLDGEAKHALGLVSRLGVGGKEKQNVLVFDLGGGTFDVSFLVMGENGELEVKATAGDTYLGGDDFDNRLLEHCVQLFQEKHKKVLGGNMKVLMKLKKACERAKRLLSYVTATSIDVEYLDGGIDFEANITRAKFEEMNMDLFKKCIDIVDQCLKDACVAKGDIHEVVLVGGSTRISRIKTLLEEYFQGKKLNNMINPDEAVALGATLLAAKLAGSGMYSTLEDQVLVDVTPLSIGISQAGGVMCVLIPRNTPIPTKKERAYVLTSDDQTSVLIVVYEGERALVKDNNLLGEFELTGLPSRPARDTRIVVCFEIDANGILTVSAEHGSHRRNQVIIMNDRNRMTKEEIEKMMAEAEILKSEDKESRWKAIARGNLENVIRHLKRRVTSYDSAMRRLDQATKDRLVREIQKTSDWLEENEDAEAFEFSGCTEELERLWLRVLVGAGL